MKTKRDDLVGHTNPEAGLTKREYFAVMALQGLLAVAPKDYSYMRSHGVLAVEFADELIDALNKG